MLIVNVQTENKIPIIILESLEMLSLAWDISSFQKVGFFWSSSECKIPACKGLYSTSQLYTMSS